MGMLAQAVRNVTSSPARAVSVASQWSRAASTGNYETFARRGYAANEIVYSAIRLLSTSSAEPHYIGKRWRRAKPQMRSETKMLRALGVVNRAGAMSIDAFLVRNGFVEELPSHPLVTLLNNPNPLTSRAQFWQTVAMDRLLAGNAYVLKLRGRLGNVAELWRLRPDRVRIIPDREKVIGGYEYTVDGQRQMFAAADVMHFKDPNPLDDYYGMPPLLPLMERVDIDNFMRGFLATFFERGGQGPGAVLAVKQTLGDEVRKEIQEGLRRQFGPAAGWHQTLVIDANEASYTELGLDRGLRDALPKEINATTEARIAMGFGIPGSILGLLIGYESSSYANKRQDWQVLWDVTLTPSLGDRDDVVNLSLTPEFAGIDEVATDLSDIRALQEDTDALQERARKNYMASIWSWEETRAMTGVDPDPATGTFFVPSNGVLIPRGQMGKAPAVPALPAGEEDSTARLARMVLAAGPWRE